MVGVGGGGKGRGKGGGQGSRDWAGWWEEPGNQNEGGYGWKG